MRFRSPSLGWCLFALAAPVPAMAQVEAVRRDAGVAVAGRITDQVTGGPIPTVLVAFHRPEESADPVWEGTSGPSGTFVISFLELGEYEIRAHMLGFASVSHRVTFDESGDVDLRVELVPEALALDPIVVAVRRRTRLETAGFYDRRDLGIGHFLTRSDIERRSPFRVADLFYTVPGARVIAARGGRPSQVLLRGNCEPLIVFDGHPVSTPLRLDDVLHVSEVEAIEVYHGSSAPVQYTQFTTCGTILVWTRETRLLEGSPPSWRRIIAAGGVLGLLLLLAR